MNPSDLSERLARFLRSKLPDADSVDVGAIQWSTEGFSQETFSLEVEIEVGSALERRAYVVKRKPVAGLLEPYDLEPEFRVLNALSALDVLSPPTPWFETAEQVLERPFYVMEKLPGAVPVPALDADGHGPFDAEERQALTPQVTSELAKLHALDWRRLELTFLGIPPSGRGVARTELDRWRQRIERAGFPISPMLARGLAWLEGNLPATDEVTLVHGDFRTGNFLIEGRGRDARLAGVLDWEMVHLGDPLEDLAWAMSRLWRAGGAHASCLAEPGDFADAYARISGRRIDAERLQFYSVLAVVKMLAIMLTGVRAFTDRRTGDLRMAIFDHQIPFLHALLGVELGIVPEM